ncbi:ubiquitinyl hydrolase [Piedraia hortae CBS 480.64]|uniref:Ubiquitin carboxyl-terminal hydrolase n=1 Tax=Piedraia hortae CBS 480.64 TaxID=1314780 RepID=A0A6A7C1B4_9PEZI|nr:ubiquitinyl hydrolase [Piedraia hortae CBS 480.64]
MSGGWNTIESDAGVFTSLIESLGAKNVQAEELLTLEPESLQELDPYGVIFLFKYPKTENKAPRDGESDSEANIWFARQTIQNACGTQALLSILLNQDIDLGKTLQEFREFTLSFPPEYRGEALSNSESIREVHNSFAKASPFMSDESRPAEEDDDVYHFIAYTSIDDTLYELDGLQPSPIRHGDHGACPKEILADAVVPVLQRRIERYPPTEIRFNLLALCPDMLQKAREEGDAEAATREKAKRDRWHWENSLRRHNFVGFIGEMLKGVTEMKVKDGSYDDWLAKAKADRK